MMGPEILIISYNICNLDNQNVIPGHVRRLHDAVIEADPGQSFPPCCGLGLVQDLVMYLTPEPQVRLQLT